MITLSTFVYHSTQRLHLYIDIFLASCCFKPSHLTWNHNWQNSHASIGIEDDFWPQQKISLLRCSSHIILILPPLLGKLILDDTLLVTGRVAAYFSVELFSFSGVNKTKLLPVSASKKCKLSIIGVNKSFCSLLLVPIYFYFE
jgi:hypothetical protein